MVKRIEFNRKAKQLLADDDLPGLTTLAVALVTARSVSKGHWTEELQQTLAAAAATAAHAWWKDGGNCHKKVCAAIGGAARDFRGRGGYRVDNTWRGGYSTDARKFGSQLFDKDAAVSLADTFGGAPTEEPEESTDADGGDKHDRRADAKATTDDFKRYKDTDSLADAASERTSHDGGHADDVRLNPKDDGEAGYGVDGATRGLNTGRVLPSMHQLAYEVACEEVLAEELKADRNRFYAIQAAGFDAWVGKDKDRKRLRGHYSRWYGERLAAVRGRKQQIIDSAWAPQMLQAEYLGAAAVPVDHGAHIGATVPAPQAPKGSDVLSAAWPATVPTKRRGRAWEPATVWVGYWEKIVITGEEWADMRRNVKTWEREDRSKTELSLLDLVGPGVRVVTMRVLPPGWERPMLAAQRAVSLLDVADV
jgi:hypothetical protein